MTSLRTTCRVKARIHCETFLSEHFINTASGVFREA